ncbi:MAG: hypothetical protein Q9170_000884 [Blastenia crenularia]
MDANLYNSQTDTLTCRTKAQRPPPSYNSAWLVHFVDQVKECLKRYTYREINCSEEGPQTRVQEYPDPYRFRVGPEHQLEVPQLHRELDSHVPRMETKTSTVAAQDRLFLSFGPRRMTPLKDTNQPRQTYNLMTLILTTITSALTTIAMQGRCLIASKKPDRKRSIPIVNDFLKCLRKVVLEGLIYHDEELLDKFVRKWHHHCLQERQPDRDWFSEWPSGRRPLNTTWPWNIRPSLVVLWGVCWMFYDNSTRADQALRQQLEDEEVAPLVWVRQTPQSATLSQQDIAKQITLNSDTYLHDTAWLQSDESGGVHTRLLPRNLGNNPPSTIPPAHRHSAPSSIAKYSPDYNIWQSPPVDQPQHSQQQPQGLGPTPRRSAPSEVHQPYVPFLQQAASQGDSRAAAAFSPILRLPVGQMQTYSPHSDVSKDETRSPCFSILPSDDMSPNMVLVASPSVESRQSHPSAGRKSEEPPRNPSGQITCDHLKCIRDPPVFSRRKHMDKHTRPYVCNLPGCEKVRGFTYSGGLSRHQREVHRSYGGPKASYMCPHNDCKRSTGSGFSRRENLQEHLRRVHRQAGDAEIEKQAVSKVNSLIPMESRRRRRRVDEEEDEAEPVLPESRKRRRNDYESDDDDTDTEKGGLSAEVKRLRKELQEKDERLRKLEQIVELLSQRIT